jgi:hypothetical protein
MKVKNNYMKLLKKILMSLIKNILSLKDMKILKELSQLKMNPRLMKRKLSKKLKKN